MNPRRFPITLALLTLVPLTFAARPPENPFAARPSDEHALLRKMAGSWTVEFRLTMPGAPEMASDGTEQADMLGDLWLSARYDDPDMMGGAYAGAQLLGYDPDKEKYVSMWVDSTSTAATMQEGTYDEATRTLTLLGKSSDPLTGIEGTVRSTMHWTDDDHRIHTMFVPGPGGSEMEMFQIEYTRAK
jgi:hypothetical protein